MQSESFLFYFLFGITVTDVCIARALSILKDPLDGEEVKF